ncbi:MAG: cobalt-zinc-cadmium resistance protein [Gammaproteobacteria bacterium]|nr:cobalt-zinc-cadmium resistance protein [Gammaproteobacteria bacterium]
MLIFLAGGAISLGTMHKEEFPNIEPGVIEIAVPYLGAAPEEVEEAVCIRVEEAVEGVDGIDRIVTRAGEGMCSVRVILQTDIDVTTPLNQIKGKVDAISTFPSETEKPIVSSLQFRGQTISLMVYGKTDEATLKLFAEEIREDLAALDGISQVAVGYARPWEISIEVSENTLRQYNITMSQISDAIRRQSLDLPGGSIKTDGGEILLRSKGQAYIGTEYQKIIVLTRPDGTNVSLGEIADIKDSFQEGYLKAKFDGDRAVSVIVYRVGEEDTITSAEAVKRYVKRKQAKLPEGIKLQVWLDESIALDRRISALTKNAYAGLALVLLILALFLRFKVAIWVAAGIPIAILGAIWAFPYAGINISSLTVLAFILVLGIVVDDAIVVGERIYSHESQSKSNRDAAISGTGEVITPVVFGVLTTIAAFLPILLIQGRMGDFFSIIGWVVLVCLVFSILECMFILPAHLAHRKTKGYLFQKSFIVKTWIAFQGKLSGGLETFAENQYRRFLEKTLEWRWVTWSIATGILVISVALIFSGRVIFQFFPAVEGDRIYATLIMPQGINVEYTESAASQIEAAARKTAAQIDADLGNTDRSVVLQIFQSIGSTAARSSGPPSQTAGGSHLAEIVVSLPPIEERPGWNTNRIGDLWRENTGPITDAVELQFETSAFKAGEALAIQLKGKNIEELREAAEMLKAELKKYPGVVDLRDSFRAGKQEIKLNILSEAKPLGLTLNDLARQVRQAFYGEEAQRIQRGTDDVRVMVRYPETERKSVGSLENMRIRTKENLEVPFGSVAKVDYGTGYSAIYREDQRRLIEVIGDVNRSTATPEEILAAVEKTICAQGSTFSNPENRCFNLDFPDTEFRLSGEQEERNKALGSMVETVPLALMIIFALLAIPLKSYMQPLVIMSVIPFGAVGAIVGHYIMGWDLIFFSLLGIIALSGVVVNASLVLVDYINRLRRNGTELFDAVSSAGVVRFRPIILTSVTTFVGLIPLMTDSDPETFMFIPMAISLAFGVLFSTAITLFLVPSLYLMMEDWLGLWRETSKNQRPHIESKPTNPSEA